MPSLERNSGELLDSSSNPDNAYFNFGAKTIRTFQYLL